eukprot:2644329-Pyramimonas_sp.AAC.1
MMHGDLNVFTRNSCLDEAGAGHHLTSALHIKYHGYTLELSMGQPQMVYNYKMIQQPRTHHVQNSAISSDLFTPRAGRNGNDTSQGKREEEKGG